MEFIELTIDDSAEIVPLAHKLRPAADPAQLREYLAAMFSFPMLYCFGLQCKTIELNTYIQNSRSHKFYFNEGHSILGFHFQKVV